MVRYIVVLFFALSFVATGQQALGTTTTEVQQSILELRKKLYEHDLPLPGVDDLTRLLKSGRIELSLETSGSKLFLSRTVKDVDITQIGDLNWRVEVKDVGYRINIPGIALFLSIVGFAVWSGLQKTSPLNRPAIWGMGFGIVGGVFYIELPAVLQVIVQLALITGVIMTTAPERTKLLIFLGETVIVGFIIVNFANNQSAPTIFTGLLGFCLVATVCELTVCIVTWINRIIRVFKQTKPRKT